jgi:hypothetical protein
VSVQVTDPYGNPSSVASQTVTVAETLPTVTVDAIEGDNIVTGSEVQSGFSITGTTTGIADGSEVIVEILTATNAVVDTYQAGVSSGSWNATVSASDSSALGTGVFNVKADVSDAYGNAAPGASQSFTVQTSVPLPVFNLAAADQIGTAANPGTYDGNVVLTGQTGAGDTVTLTSGGNVIATTTAGITGGFEFDNVGIASGANAFTAQATDASGNSANYSLTIQGQTAPNSPNLALEWIQTTLRAIALDADPPTVASRSLAMESLAVYDAISGIDGTPGYLLNMTAPSDASPDAAVAAAADTVLDYLYAAQAPSFDAQLASELAAIPNGQSKTDGVAFGVAVADAIIALRANDGSNVNVTDVGSTGVGVWQPTPPSYAPALDPQWADVTPFALTSPGQFLPAGPPPLDSQEYADDVALTESLGSADSTTRTTQQTQIAKFWNDQTGTDTPPGEWDSIAATVANQQGNSLAADAQLFAELNVAEADSAIAAWNSKFTYNAWRPVTVIANADSVGNPYFAAAGVTQAADWMPLLTTPNFPEDAAGHPTFSAAAAEILDNFFGTDVSFTATSESTPGTTFSFAPTDLADAISEYGLLPGTATLNGGTQLSSFDIAALQAGDSRIYGGIHFLFSVDQGLSMGAEVGDQTLAAFSTTLDTVPPKIVINEISGLTTNQDPTITGTVDTNFGVSSLLVSLDGGTLNSVTVNTDGTFSFTPTLPLDGSADGPHALTFEATDDDGLQGTQSFSFNLASQPPQIILDGDGIQDGGTLTASAQLVGTVLPDPGASIVAFSYSIDGGATVPIGFDPNSGAFDQTLNLSAVAVGGHTITLTATDGAGNVATDVLQVSMPSEPTLTIASLTPEVNAAQVGVTFRPEITFSRPVDPSTLTSSSFYATDPTGAVVPGTIVPIDDASGNEIGAWLLFNNQLPGNSTITLHVDGALITDTDGSMLDAARSGTPGSTFTESFTTVSTAAVPGTAISGIVVDPGPDDTPMTPDDVKAAPDGLLDYAHDTWLLPIAGVKVYVLGDEQNAVYTNAHGQFTLTNVPAGDVKIEFDGTTATNPPAGYYFPTMVMDMNVQPGANNTVMGGMGDLAEQAANAADPAVYLPRIADDILNPVSDTQPTTVTAPPDSAAAAGAFELTSQQLSEISLTVQPGSFVDENGNPVADPEIGISTVPPQIVMDMLPDGVLQHSLDITIQAPGTAVFTQPATLTLPNVFGAAPGTELDVLSFDHTTGRLVIDGTATVSADGQTVTSDPGSGVLAPGWHGITSPGSNMHTAVSAKKNGSPAGSSEVQSGVNTARSWYTVFEDGVKLAKSEAAIAAKDITQAGAKLVPEVGAALSYSQSQEDIQNYQNDVAQGKFLAGLEDGTKYFLDGAQAYLGATGIGEPIKDVLSLGSDALTLADAVVGLGKGLYNFAGQVYNYATGNEAAHQDASKPASSNAQDPADPSLEIDLSENGLPGTVQIYVDGVLQTTAAITASQANGDTQAVTISGIAGTDYHDIEVVSIGPTSGLTAGTQNDVFIDGVTFNGQTYNYTANLYGLDTNRSASFAVGSAVIPVETTYESLVQRTDAEAQFDQAILPTINAGLQATEETFSSADLTNPNNYGLSQSYIKTQQAAVTAEVDAEQVFAAHPTLFDLGQQSVDASQSYDDQLLSQIDGPIGASADDPGQSNMNGIAVSPDATLYAEIDDGSGNIQRLSFNAGQGLDVFMPADDQYTLTVYDPASNEIGSAEYTSGAPGTTIDTPNIFINPDTGAPQANGLSAEADDVLGLNPNEADNLVPGMSDAEALQEGIYANPQLASQNGVVAVVPLQGEATALVVTAPNATDGDQLAYVATGSYGLAIVDTSNHLSPTVLSQLELGGDSTSVAVDEALHLVAVAEGNGVSVVDVTDPASPTLLYERPMPASVVAAANGYFYAQSGAELQTVDMATGNLIAKTTIDQSSVNGMLVQGADLFVMHSDGILEVLDISGATPVVVGSLALGANNGNMAYSDGTLYIADGANITEGGYSAVDVSNPASPSLISDGQTGYQNQALAGGALALTGSGTAVFVQDLEGTSGGVVSQEHLLDVVDVSNPSVNPDPNNLINRYMLPATPSDVAVASGSAFVADGSSGLAVVNYVSPDTTGTPPVVTITSVPTSVVPGSPELELYEGQTISLDASISDPGQITNVELLVNGISDDTVVAYPWALSATLPSIAEDGGSNALTLQVQATDSAGNVGVSAPIMAELVPNSAPFAVTSISPASGAELSGTQRRITVTFNESVNPLSVSSSTFTLTDSTGTVYTPTSTTIPTGDTSVEMDFVALQPGTYTETIDAPDIFNSLGQALATSPLTSTFSVIAYDDIWTGNGDGNWTDPNDWSTGGAPVSGDKAYMLLPGGTQAMITTNVGLVNSLNVTGAGTLSMDSSSGGLEATTLDNSSNVSVQQGQLTVDDELNNSGVIAIDASNTASQNTAMLTANSDALIIDGGGTITLANALPSFDIDSSEVPTSADGVAGLPTSDSNPSSILENVDNTIVGTGHIGVGVVGPDTDAPASGDTVINDVKGVIESASTDYLQIVSANVVNHGLIEAVGGGESSNAAYLDFATHYLLIVPAGGGFGQIVQKGLTLDNSHGTILANGLNSSVDFLGTDIEGGTLETENGGEVAFLKSGLSADTASLGVSNAPTLDGTTTPITITGANSTFGASVVFDETFIEGDIINHSDMNILCEIPPPSFQAEGYADRTGVLMLSGDVTLSGGGFIFLDRAGNAPSNNLDTGISSESQTNQYTLTNVDNTIEGAGTIGALTNLVNITLPSSISPTNLFILVNDAAGAIVASDTQNAGDDPFADALDIVDVNLTNMGLVSATASGGMFISNSTINNDGGSISADSTDTTFVTIEGSSLSGGATETLSANATITIVGTVLSDGTFVATGSGSAIIVEDSSTSTDDTFSATGNGATITLDGVMSTGDTIGADGDATTVTVDDSSVLSTVQSLTAIGVGASLSVQNSVVTDAQAITADGTDASITIDDGSNSLAGGDITAEGTDASVTISNAALVNSATLTPVSIVADGDGATVTLNNSSLSSLTQASVAAESAGSSVIFNDSPVTNTQFELDSGGTLSFTGAASRGTYDLTSDQFTGSGGNIDIADGWTLTTSTAANPTILAIDALISIGTGSTLELGEFGNGTSVTGGTTNGNGTARFAGTNGTLILEQSAAATGAIVNFINGDTIDLGDIDGSNAGWSYSINDAMSGTLTVTDFNTGVTANLNFAWDTPPAFQFPSDPGSDFSVASDGNGGALITIDSGLSTPANSITNGGNPNAAGNSGPWNIGSAGDIPDILIASDTTLEGGGSIELLGDGNILSDPSLAGSGNTATFTNLDNTISGTGQVGDGTLALYNAPNGVILAQQSDNLSLYAFNTRNAGLIEADGGSITAFYQIDDWYGQGVVSAQNGGTITIEGILTGNGQNAIGTNSTIETEYFDSGNMTFAGTGGTFILDNSANPVNAGSISGFVAGDTIDLRDISAGADASLGYSGTSAGGTLSVSDGANTANLALVGNYMAQMGAPSAIHFTAAADGTGGTLITTDITRPHA